MVDNVSQGVVPTNDHDPTGQNPKPEHFFSSNINFAATGSKRNDLYIGGGEIGVPLNLGQAATSQYPYNQVSQSPGPNPHIIEIDDTPGNQRVLIRHNSGSGIEMRNDGTILLSSTKNTVQISGADQTVIVEGDGNLVYKGNLTLKVDGNFDIDCVDFNVNAKGNVNTNIVGSQRTNVGEIKSDVVRGSISTTSTQLAVQTYLGGLSTNVKGDYSNNVDGSATYISSGDTTLTSETKINTAAPETTIAATTLNVFGTNGIIGGQSIDIKGNAASFEGSVESPAFYGDLNGIASLARNSTLSSPANPGAPSFDEPDVAADLTLSTYLVKENGIIVSRIDEGGFIKNLIDKNTAYDGLYDKQATTGIVRSKARDTANKNNSRFTSAAIKENVVSQNISKTAPTGIGRVIKGSSTPKIGQNKIGSANAYVGLDPFLPKKVKVNLIPDPLYNPDFEDIITEKTKLAPGVSIAKFLAGTGDATNFNFIKNQQQRRDIARHLYYHAEVLRSVNTNKAAFANYRLNVVEGIYRPGPNETVTPNSINDLKLKGRAVVYQLVDVNGKKDVAAMFDLAEYWKDTLYFEKLILYYDEFDPSGELEAQIILVLPELDTDWKGTFSREVETQYNGSKLANGELVECLDIPSTPAKPSEELDESGDFGINPNKALDPLYKLNESNQLITINGQAGSRGLKPDALVNMTRLLNNEYRRMQEYFGEKLYFNDALPKLGTNRLDPSSPEYRPNSVHFQGIALDISINGFGNAKLAKLVDAAMKAGFTGFGFGRTILHIDTGRNRYWGYNNTRWGGKSIDDHWGKYIKRISPPFDGNF